jgi:hypothetical protein
MNEKFVVSQKVTTLRAQYCVYGGERLLTGNPIESFKKLMRLPLRQEEAQITGQASRLVLAGDAVL